MRFTTSIKQRRYLIEKELLLLAVICLSALLTVRYVGAYWQDEPVEEVIDAISALPDEIPSRPGNGSASNYALQFDGLDDYARVVDVGNFDFATSFTIEAWVMPDSVGGTGLFKGLVSGRTSDQPNSGGGWIMYLPNSDYSQWGMSVCTPGCVAPVAATGSLIAGQWQHLAATYDGSVIQILQNGVAIDSLAHSGDVTDVGYLFFGAWLGTFQGAMDEIRVWNIARTPEAIRSTIFSSLHGNEAGLAGYWPLDDGAGQFASDATGNGQLAQLGSSDGLDSMDPTWILSGVPIIPPSIQLIPFLGGLGTDIGITSYIVPGFNCSWSAGEIVEVWWDRPEAKLATYTVAADGCFEGLFLLNGEEQLAGSLAGDHEVQARGSVSGIVTSPFVQVESELHLSPATGPALVDVAVTGCGWDGASRVDIRWQQNNELLARPDVDPSTGCIDDTITIPRTKDDIYGLLATTDFGHFSGAAYWVTRPTIFLTPGDGPAGARVPLAGCGWSSEEQLNFSFANSGEIFDTWGTSIGGCITTNGPTDPTLLIPITTTLGTKIIEATGSDSGQVVNTLFKVVDRTLSFDPNHAMPGDPVAGSGCGWVGNDQVTIEWGYPDPNNLPIRWLTNVDGSTGCFGLEGDFNFDVPANTITGLVVVTATGDFDGETTSDFTVNHGGYIEIPVPGGDVGDLMTVDIFDAIIGETLFFMWDSGASFDGVGAATSSFSYNITLPIYSSVGVHTLRVEGTKGFDDQAAVNILDNAEISLVSGGDLFPGDWIEIEGSHWSAGERISFELQAGGDFWPINQIVTVGASSTDFNEQFRLPSYLPPGPYTLGAQGNKGRDAETVLTIAEGAIPAISLNASFADEPPNLDGILSGGEWDYDDKADFENGFITVRSDETRLYILLDLLADTGNNSLGADNFWLTFDLLNQQQIDPGLDLNFRLDSTGDMVLEHYTGPGTFAPRNSTLLRSAYGSGFGCYYSDASFYLEFTGLFPRFKCNNHRTWEIAIDLATILAEPGDQIRLGLRAISQSPAFSEEIPDGFPSDFSELGVISLAPSQLDPNPPSGAVIGIGSNDFEIEVTQAIQDADNSLHLVADKNTVVRVYPQVEDESMVRVFLFGEKDGQDLPGSPLVTLAAIPASIDREELYQTANFLLPRTWTAEGTTNLTTIIEELDGQNPFADTETAIFHERRIPEIWVFPFNEGSTTTPILPTNTDMVAQERVLTGLLPTPSVTFVHRTWPEIRSTGPISFSTMKKDLNNYWTMLSFAKYLSGDRSPMPELLYGFKVSRDPKAVGTSDPVYSGGRGRVVVGQADGRDFNSTTMIHEVNHDLDRSSTGTWGRHVANPENVKDRSWGCDAGGPDLSWPYDGNDSIQEVGFDANNPWREENEGHLTVLPTNRNDFMSYCWHKGTPIQWISPYRWQAMFAKFTPTAAAPPTAEDKTAESVYYISGHLSIDGSGSLDPIQTMPGVVSDPIVPGEYSIEVLNSAQEVLLSVPFMAVFTDTEGFSLDNVFFSYQIPSHEDVGAILLKHDTDVLDSIIPSFNPPLVVMTAPGDGDTWSDQETISWQASDADGDPLQFTILYSPDEGVNWYPVASEITGTEHTVVVDLLPGGVGGKIQLIASDGFHTVQAQSSGTFTVPHPALTAIIDTPGNGERLLPSNWIRLGGSVSAATGETVENATFVWSVDGQVVEISQEADIQLVEGIYEISLAVYDELGNQGEDSVTIIVTPFLNVLYLPALQK